MTVEKHAGHLERAVVHGWKATRRGGLSEVALHALFDLAGVLREGGDLEAAEDAYTVVAEKVTTYDYRVMALDALAYIAALTGRELLFDDICSLVDAENWEGASAVISSQIPYFRGLASLSLGRTQEGQEWLERALASAERHGFGKLVFDAENALAAARTSTAPAAASQRPHTPLPGSVSEDVRGVRRELRELREAVATAG
jgi:hypothetical protein